jgi:hypothetical protein
MKGSTRGKTSASPTAGAVAAAYRQAQWVTMNARSGRKINCPVAFEPVRDR